MAQRPSHTPWLTSVGSFAGHREVVWRKLPRHVNTCTGNPGNKLPIFHSCVPAERPINILIIGLFFFFPFFILISNMSGQCWESSLKMREPPWAGAASLNLSVGGETARGRESACPVCLRAIGNFPLRPDSLRVDPPCARTFYLQILVPRLGVLWLLLHTHPCSCLHPFSVLCCGKHFCC